MKKLVLISALLSFIVSFAQEKNDTQGGKLLPSEGIALTYYAVNNNPNADRMSAIGHILPRVITNDLSKEEQFFLGELYFWNFKPDDGLVIYEKFLKEDTPRGRAAWQRYLQIKFMAFEAHAEVEKLVKDYRKKFKPLPDDRSGLYGQVYNLANMYEQKGDYDKVISLIKEELDYLDYKGAYNSFQLPAFFNKSFRETDKIDVAIEMLENAINNLSATLKDREENIPQNDTFYTTYNRNIRGMETVETQKIGFSQTNQKFEELIDRLGTYLEKFKSLKS